MLEAEMSGKDIESSTVSDDRPTRPLADAARYLRNSSGRMDYLRYLQEGLPISSTPMELMIKQVNHRAKGTEMFWNDPDGDEAILQVLAASLSDNGRLAKYLNHRPEWAFVRRN